MRAFPVPCNCKSFSAPQLSYKPRLCPLFRGGYDHMIPFPLRDDFFLVEKDPRGDKPHCEEQGHILLLILCIKYSYRCHLYGVTHLGREGEEGSSNRYREEASRHRWLGSLLDGFRPTKVRQNCFVYYSLPTFALEDEPEPGHRQSVDSHARWT